MMNEKLKRLSQTLVIALAILSVFVFLDTAQVEATQTNNNYWGVHNLDKNKVTRVDVTASSVPTPPLARYGIQGMVSYYQTGMVPQALQAPQRQGMTYQNGMYLLSSPNVASAGVSTLFRNMNNGMGTQTQLQGGVNYRPQGGSLNLAPSVPNYYSFGSNMGYSYHLPNKTVANPYFNNTQRQPQYGYNQGGYTQAGYNTGTQYNAGTASLGRVVVGGQGQQQGGAFYRPQQQGGYNPYNAVLGNRYGSSYGTVTSTFQGQPLAGSTYNSGAFAGAQYVPGQGYVMPACST